MSVAEWADTYGIHNWRIIWSGFRKLTWTRFEPTTTECNSDAMSSSRTQSTLYSYSNFIACWLSHFTSTTLFLSSHVYLNWKFLEVITWLYQNELIHVFSTEALLQFPRLFTVIFHFTYFFGQLPHSSVLKVSWENHMNVAEWANKHGIHNWRIIWSSSSKLTWAVFEPTATELHSDAPTDWVLMPRAQLALRQRCTAAPISLLVQCHILFSLLSSSVATLIWTESFTR